MTTWTVLANGHSLANVRVKDIDTNGPVVAVNSAVLRCYFHATSKLGSPSALPIDFWCANDPPRKHEQVWAALTHEQRRLLPVLWCKEKTASVWEERHVRTWPGPETEQAFRRWALPGVRRRTNMMSLTITTAITRCIGHGATRIVLFGVDMAGRGYAHGYDSEDRAERAWDARWKHERNVFELAAQEWAERGVEVVRRT